MDRQIEPEWLDELPANDPRAMRSRRDLRRVNALMGNVRVLAATLTAAPLRRLPKRLVDLGAGDGTLALRLAWRLSPRWRDVEVLLVDRLGIVSDETRRQFEAVSWRVKSVTADIFEWLAQPSLEPACLMIANLFLHHFSEPALIQLLSMAAERTCFFVACEPRRSPAAARAGAWLWCLGCNRVTCHDAAISVRAGFAGEELSALWPRDGSWQLEEMAAGLFSHCFVARRRADQCNAKGSDGRAI